MTEALQCYLNGIVMFLLVLYKDFYIEMHATRDKQMVLNLIKIKIISVALLHENV